MFIVENDLIGLTQYTHDDDIDMYTCWQDIDTQKGYNCIFNQAFNKFKDFEIERFKFWVIVMDKKINQKVGVLRLGLDEDSLKILRKLGFIRYPDGDRTEKNCFTGKETV